MTFEYLGPGVIVSAGSDLMATHENPLLQPASRGVRWLFASGGVACVALGAIGAFVPGLPTTVFVLAGSWLLARSSPRLDRRMRTSALFAPYARYLDPGVPMPRKAKAAALASMWASIAVSAAFLGYRGAPGVAAAVVAAG